MKTSFAALLLSALLCAAPVASRATHYAVCVGVNQYKTSYIPSSNWLSGCVPDANHVSDNIMERGEWTSATVTKLTNSSATKTAIRSAITSAASSAVTGDVFLYYHSSHGGNDYGNYDVYLCTYNADYTDSELASDLAQFKSGVKVVVMVDACHSGGLFKSVNGARALSKASPGDFDLAARVGAAIDAIRADETARGIKASAKITSSEIGWVTAADYNQYSWDGNDGGAFTEAVIAGWQTGTCDNAHYGNQDGYANFYELWNYAKDIATGEAASGEDHTDAQCYNESVLRATIAGWVGDEEPAGVRFVPIPAQTAIVGETLQYTLVATNMTGVTGSIAYSVVSATAPAGTYSLSGAAFSFTPSTDGDFTFTFLATNATAKVSSKTTMAVSAVLAAPTSLNNSGITTASFTANWGAVAGAASYLLDVASTDFDAPRGPRDDALLSEDFSGFTGTAADRSSTLDDYLTGTGWTGSKVFENDGSAKLGSSSYAGWIATPELDLTSGGTVSFELTQYGTDANTVTVSILSDGNETAIGTATPGTTETVSFAIPAASAATSVKIATSAKRAIIDNLVVTGGAAADVLSAQSVSGTSYTVTDLIAGTYYWRVRAVGNAKGPYSETEEVTLVADPSAPPAIRPIDDIAVTVGETVTLAVHASAPEAAPVTSLAITSGDSSAYLMDGVFSFAPAAVGTYSFTITAINANGFAEESFTVTATLAEPTAPEATSVGHNAFTASWTAVPGATSYDLIVFEGQGNSGGEGGETPVAVKLTETFANATFTTTSSSYTDQTISGGDLGTWTATACRGDDTGPVVRDKGTLTSPGIADGVSAVEVDYSWPYSESGNVAIKLYVNGTEKDSFTVTGGTDGTATYSFTAVPGPATLQFENTGTGTKHRMRFDEIRITTAGTRSLARAVGDVVFSNNVGAVTSYTVTGLQSETDYTFAIRALAGGAATEWTAFSSVTTAVAPAAPAWGEIPAMTASVGHPFRVDLAPYVSGVPAPTLTLTSGSGTLTGTFLEFTPAAAGSTTFTVSAANGVGDAASTTFTVTATVHEPVQYAVCVGINEYEQISSLAGCVNDAQVMASNLVERGGWAPANVTLLTDSQATKAAIRAAITNAAANALAGDTFVYQHSSHGGQFNATEDDEDPLTGEDGKATFLCVYDENYYDNTTAYNDYEIAADLAAFPAGVKVVVIADACHSGGLFKSKAAAKASAASFDLAGRVTALMNADRARRRARGEDVARTLSSSEIGWATAAEYYEYSYDGGFYHTDEWLTDASYGDEYYDEYTEDYNYPASYKVGGAFLASAIWGWWNGDADSDAEAGDNDGLCDAYEFWKKGYDFCSVIGEFWYDDSDYNYYPQCANTNVLKSVELGWVVDPRPAAPANPAAPNPTSTSFTATWDAVSNAVSYLLHVQKKVADGSRTADGEILLSEDFAGFTSGSNTDISGSLDSHTATNGWTGYKVYSDNGRAKLGTGSYNGWLATPARDIPAGSVLSFTLAQYSSDAGTVSVNISTDGGSTWTALCDAISPASGGADIEVEIDADYTGANIQFISSVKRFYLDNVVLTAPSGTWEDLAGYAPKSVAGTSQLVDGLDADTDYRFSVRAVDAEGLESVDSARVTVHTAAADSAPVWSAIPAQTVIVGGRLELDLTPYVSGSPVPVIVLDDSEGYVPTTTMEDSTFVFEPAAAGDYTFSFIATNTEGSDTTTVSVAVSPAPPAALSAPVLLPATDITTNSFTINWSAVDNADGYLLDVIAGDSTGLPARDATGTWTLVTDASTLAIGDQIIIAAADYDMAISTTQQPNNRVATEIVKNGSTLETPDATVAVLTLGTGTVANAWSFYDANSNGYLYAASSSSNHLKTETTLSGNSSWSISIADDGVATIVAQGNYTHNSLRYNASNNPPIFSAYASNSSIQGKVCLYRLEGGSSGGSSLPNNLAVTGTSYELTGLDSNTTYSYQLRATSSVYGLTSPVSAPGSATTLGEVAPVTVPTLTVTNVTATTALATWTACDGVSSYTLQLAADDQFSTGGSVSGETLTETFANITFSPAGSGYVDQTIPGGDLGTWTATSCRGDQGSPVVRYNGTLTSPTIANGVAAVEFDYDWPFSESGSCDIELYVGGTLMDTATVSCSSSGTATYTLDSPVAGPTTIEFLNKASSGKRIRVNEVRITTSSSGSAPSGSLIAEYTVSGTSYSFTGLSLETTYYARVKGDAGWSNVEEFTTDPAGDFAPGWSATFPATWSMTAGDIDSLEVTDYLSGVPTPAITLATDAPAGDYEFEDGSFIYMPTHTGTFTFTFTASNDVGTANAVLVATVSGTAPSWDASFPATATVTAGEDYEFSNVSAYASGSPSPIVELTSADSEDCDYDNDTFLFNTATPGAYEFVFTASNVLGTATATLAVTVTAAPVTVPTLTVPSVSSSAALAVWTACDGVSSYTLQLSTNEFPVASSGDGTAILSEDFANFTATGNTDIGDNDALDTYTTTAGWTGFKVYCNGGEAKIGASRNQGWIMTPALDVSGTFTVIWKARRYGTSDKSTLLLGVSENGTDFVDETVTITDDMTTYTNTFTVSGSTAYVRWMGSVASNSRFYLDDITITAGSSSGNDTSDDIQEFTVSDTSYRFTGLETGTQYYVRVKGDDDWSNVVTFTPIDNGVATYAPYWFPLPATNVTVSTEIELDLANYVYSYPDHILTLSTAVNSSLYEFEDGLFFFQPDAVGTYAFTFTATNAEGSNSATLTVTVSDTAAPVTVPTLLVTNVTDTAANASWTACDGVSSYTLQLATNEFPVASSVSRSAIPILSEDFLGFSGNGTADIGANGTLNDHTATPGWTGSKVYTASETVKVGASSGQGWLMTPSLDASGTLTVAWSAYRYGTSDKNTLLLGVSENGTDFDEETITIGDEMTGYTNTFTVTGPTVYVRWMASGSSKARFYLDDVTITSSTSGGDVPASNDIQEFTVSGTSYSFTDLTPETTYYARVKGDAGWSNVEEFTTEAAALPDSAPVWSALPAQTVNVGETLEFDLAPYVTGSPVPVILLGDTAFVADMQGSTFVFDPSSSGDYTFSFTASNAVGTADATLSVTAVAAAPELTISPDTSFSVTVGDTVEFSVTATGIPTPDIFVSSYEGAYFDFTNGEFRFETTEPGTYTFEVSASNVDGTDTLTVTVEVLATVPTLSVSNVTATTAFASWNNCANVTEYTLQLSTNEQFEATSGAANISEDFSGFSPSARYSTESQTVDSGTWSYENAMLKPGAAAAGTGSAGYAQLRAGDGILYLPAIDSPSFISVVARASAATDGTLTLQKEDNGSWTDLQSWSLTSTAVEYTYAFAGASASTALRLCAVGRAVYIYDVTATGESSSSDGTGTFQVLEGSGTSSYTFTDLLPDTTYYARVKGDSDWSNVVSFHTLAAPASLAEAFGLPVGITDEYIVCRITSFSVDDATGAEGTFAITAEDNGVLVAESQTLAANVRLVVLGAATLDGGFTALDDTACDVELTSRTAPYGFRVGQPGLNRFFQVRLVVE